MTIVSAVCTLFLLVGEDSWTLFIAKQYDFLYDVLTYVVFFLLVCEFILKFVGTTGYRWSLQCWIDFISTVSIILSLQLSSSGAAEGTNVGPSSFVSETLRAALVSTRVSRLSRLVRIVRLVRVPKLISICQRVQDKKLVTTPPPSETEPDTSEECREQWGQKKLHELEDRVSFDIAMKVILSGLFLTLVLPFLEPMLEDAGPQRALEWISLASERDVHKSATHFIIAYPATLHLQVNGSIWHSSPDRVSMLRPAEIRYIQYGLSSASNISTYALLDTSAEMHLAAAYSLLRTVAITLILGTQSMFLIHVLHHHLLSPLASMIECISHSLDLKVLHDLESTLCWGSGEVREKRADTELPVTVPRRTGRHWWHLGMQGSREIGLLTMAFQSLLQANEFLKVDKRKKEKNIAFLQVLQMETPRQAMIAHLDSLLEETYHTPGMRTELTRLFNTLRTKKLDTPQFDSGEFTQALDQQWLNEDFCTDSSPWEARFAPTSVTQHECSTTVFRCASRDFSLTLPPLRAMPQEADMLVQQYFYRRYKTPQDSRNQLRDMVSYLQQTSSCESMDWTTIDSITNQHTLVWVSAVIFDILQFRHWTSVHASCWLDFVNDLAKRCSSMQPFYNELRAAALAWNVLYLIVTMRLDVWFASHDLFSLCLACLSRCVQHPGFESSSQRSLMDWRTLSHQDNSVERLLGAHFCEILRPHLRTLMPAQTAETRGMISAQVVVLLIATRPGNALSLIRDLVTVNRDKSGHSSMAPILMMRALLALGDYFETWNSPASFDHWAYRRVEQMRYQRQLERETCPRTTLPIDAMTFVQVKAYRYRLFCHFIVRPVASNLHRLMKKQPTSLALIRALNITSAACDKVIQDQTRAAESTSTSDPPVQVVHIHR